MHVKEDDPPSITNKYGVRFRGLPVPKKELSVPLPTTKRRKSSVNFVVKDKEKEKVSTSALTMCDIVGSWVEIHHNREKSTLSHSLSHVHDSIVLPRNSRDVVKDNVESSSATQEKIRVLESRINDSEIPASTFNVVLPESILSKNVNAILPESGLADKEILLCLLLINLKKNLLLYLMRTP